MKYYEVRSVGQFSIPMQSCAQATIHVEVEVRSLGNEAYTSLWEALNPYAFEKMSSATEKSLKFVHYTSASNALSIIKNKQVWMRNAREMNDFSEIEHGHNCLFSAWHDEDVGGEFKKLLEEIETGLATKIENSFTERAHDRNRESFIISVSEHGFGAVDEGKYGRLSMWRAYGGDTSVALVMNNGPFLRDSSATMAFTSPVLYCDEQGFKKEFVRTINALRQNLELAKQLGGDLLSQLVQSILHFSALSTKHSGFAEEREWRVILSPTLFPSNKVSFDIEAVNGVPQRVYKFPLADFPDEGFFGATLNDLLEEIIIGPTLSSETILDALGGALTQEGVTDGFDRVRESKIPLRR